MHVQLVVDEFQMWERKKSFFVSGAPAVTRILCTDSVSLSNLATAESGKFGARDTPSMDCLSFVYCSVS